MTELTLDSARELHRAVDYPKNQSYDPVTMDPMNDVTAARVRFLEEHVPQLWEGGKSLLDVGSSKGFVSMLLRNRFDEVVGYEVGYHAHQAAIAAVFAQRAENVTFVNRPFRMIEVSKHAGFRRYEVVYAGSVHHHFFKDCLLHGAPPHLGLHKLAALAERYLILDGPLEFGTDFSLRTWQKAYGWGPAEEAMYTLAEHDRALAPAFERITEPVEDERGRQCVVYERRQPDVPYADPENVLVSNIIRGGTVLAANKARETGSVIRSGEVRLKLDPGGQNEAVLGILNALPAHCPETIALVMAAGRPVGDVARWVDGDPITSLRELAEPWLALNHVLASVGLVEIHYKLGDYVRTADGRVVDVDVDMVNHCENVALAHEFLERWRVPVAQAMGPEIADHLVRNLAGEWVFHAALQMLREARHGR